MRLHHVAIHLCEPRLIAVPVEVFRLAAAVRAGLAPSSNREEQEDWKRAQAPHRIC